MFVLLRLCPWWLSLFSYIYVTFSLPIYSLSHLLSPSLRPPSQSNTRCAAAVSTAGSASCRQMASARIPNWCWTQPVSRCPRPKPRGPSSSGAKWRTPTKVKTRGNSLVRSGTLKKRSCLWLVACGVSCALCNYMGQEHPALFSRFPELAQHQSSFFWHFIRTLCVPKDLILSAHTTCLAK